MDADLGFDLLMDPHLGRNEYPADRMAKLQANDKHVSVMAKIMNKVRLLYFYYMSVYMTQPSLKFHGSLMDIFVAVSCGYDTCFPVKGL